MSVLDAIADDCGLTAYESPLQFAVNRVTFAHDVSARQERFDPSLTPYVVPILEEWEFRGCGQREVVVVAPEQTAKSLSWQLGLLWSFVHEPGLSIVVYPSDDKCDEVNRAKLQPLMRSVPSLAAGLAQPHAKARNRYNFGSIVSYFQGAGERISAHSARIRIADEVDDWIETEDKSQSPKLEDLRKRGRTFDDGIMVAVSSPRGESPLIWPAYERTSRGYWYLRCFKCGQLTMRSCDVSGTWRDGERRGGLQFETTEDDRGRRHVIVGSERLVCPACGREHEYHERREMTCAGDYVHELPGLVHSRTGFQWGALASQWPSLSWSYIAECQLLAGRSGDIRDQANFDNSIRGLPFRQRKRGDGEDTRRLLLSRCADPPPVDDVEALFLVADTQDDGWRWELRALTVNCDRCQIAWGNAEYLEIDDDLMAKLKAAGDAEAAATGDEWTPPQSLGDMLRAGWGDVPVTMALIDEGGHRKREVSEFVQANQRVFAYKGGWQGGFDSDAPWCWSKNQEKLVLARRGDYQDRLLWYLHFHEGGDNNNWRLVPEDQTTDAYINELLAVRPNARRKDGDLRRNWDHGGRTHDYFDVSMMYLVLEDVAVASLDATEWRQGTAEILQRDAGNTDPKPDTDVHSMHKGVQPKHKNWATDWKW